MKIAIVIPTFNRKEILRQLVLQIISQCQIVKFDIIIIPVVDGSTDGTLEMIKAEFEDISYISGEGDWWFTKSLNEGVKLAISKKVDFVLTMNDDVVLEDHFFEKLENIVHSIQKKEIVGVASYSLENRTKITNPGVKKIKWWRAKLITYYAHLEDVKNNPPKGKVYSIVLPTRGLLIPIEILKELDFFDERFPQYFSDYDFCLRAVKKGATIILNYDICLYTMDQLTAKTVGIQNSFSTHIKSIFNKYSRTYFPHVIRYYWRHGNRLAFPFTISLIYFVSFFKIFKNKIQTPLPSI